MMVLRIFRYMLIMVFLFTVLIVAAIAIGNSRRSDLVSFVAVINNRSDLFVYDPLNRELTNITDTPFVERSFGWSSEGALFYVESDNPAHETDTLSVMYRPGDAQLIEIDNTFLTYGVTWSPDGKQLAYFSSYPHNISDIYVIDLPDVIIHNVTQSDDLSESNPRWSPDGEHLLFRQNGDLYTINVSTGERLLLADIQNLLSETVIWSPDGQYVAFYIQNQTSLTYAVQVYLITIETGSIERLDLPRDINSELSWSPDGQEFVLVAEDNNLLIYDTRTASFRLIEGENRRISPAWSPDGRWIAFIENRQLQFYDTDNDTIFSVRIQGRIREPLIWRSS